MENFTVANGHNTELGINTLTFYGAISASTITTTGYDLFGGQPKTESFRFNQQKNEIEVVFRQKSNMTLTSNPSQPAPDKVWKEVYGIVDGKLKMLRKIMGTHTPQRFEPEQFKSEE